jgi:hypothetical protein
MVEGVNSSTKYFIYKNFLKCHNVPPPSTTIKKKKVKRQPKEWKKFFAIPLSDEDTISRIY